MIHTVRVNVVSGDRTRPVDAQGICSPDAGPWFSACAGSGECGETRHPLLAGSRKSVGTRSPLPGKVVHETSSSRPRRVNGHDGGADGVDSAGSVERSYRAIGSTHEAVIETVIDGELV